MTFVSDDPDIFKQPLSKPDDPPKVKWFKVELQTVENLIKFWVKYVDHTTKGQTTYATYEQFLEAILISDLSFDGMDLNNKIFTKGVGETKFRV